MDGSVILQTLATLVGIVVSGVVGVASGKASARAQVHTTELTTTVQAEANDNEAAKQVVAGAIALSAGVRAELDAVRRDLAAEREANAAAREADRATRTRLIARIEQLEQQHVSDSGRITHLEEELQTTKRANAELRDQLDGLARQTRPRGTRSRKDDPPA